MDSGIHPALTVAVMTKAQHSVQVFVTDSEKAPGVA
jgi:hypothetical protein